MKPEKASDDELAYYGLNGHVDDEPAFSTKPRSENPLGTSERIRAIFEKRRAAEGEVHEFYPSDELDREEQERDKFAIKRISSREFDEGEYTTAYLVEHVL